ncbi:hypothetical protein D5073_18740 [Pectobacterium versatile]|nr:hypothetical protein [Pectobacterium versatile]ASN85121.1 Hypothetical protein SCC1_1683 [Pectobacterium versatile]MBQ4765376.1 hypothetical protein [Pectobacterium versatile]POY55556.1 hypothetical protein F018LOC_01486 [Pectobacterium versatile]POY58959.1 hypothetical protein PB70LOC_02316 [Pectobacterium versatile]POY62058.1 hypothetical protein PB69LOC_02845 [Pectobacterium versatile]
MQNNVTDGLTTVASHPLTVQVINQGPGIWGNVATGLITAGAAIGAVMLTHKYTLWREKQVSEDRLRRARHFIAIELVFLLEQFAEACSDLAADSGNDNDDPQPTREPGVDYPKLSFTDICGDWQVLDTRLMYRIRELLVLQKEAHKAIAYIGEGDYYGERKDFFRERRYQYARLGLKAIIQVRRLRMIVGFPETRLAATFWSAQPVLWEVWRIERRRRAKEAAEYRESYATEPYEER